VRVSVPISTAQRSTFIRAGPVKIAVDDNTKLTAADYRNNLYMQIQQIKREAKARAAKAVPAPAPAKGAASVP
jgi:hypothetical protein